MNNYRLLIYDRNERCEREDFRESALAIFSAVKRRCERRPWRVELYALPECEDSGVAHLCDYVEDASDWLATFRWKREVREEEDGVIYSSVIYGTNQRRFDFDEEFEVVFSAEAI